MHVGHPLFPWGLLAVPLPILLHLFFRRRRANIEFSTLQFFQQQKRYLAHRRRVREWLLLLVRTLSILVLTLALAGITLQRFSPALAARTAVAIVLDDTLSMDRKLGAGMTAFALAAQKADEILNTLSEGDAAALTLVSGRTGIALTRKRQAVRRVLEELRVTGASGSFAAALQRAQQDLTAGGIQNREIYVISDFQSNQAPSAPIELEQTKGLRLYLVPLSGPSDNLSIPRLALSTRPQMVNKPLVIPYEIANHGEHSRDTEVSLVIGTETIRSDALHIPASDRATGRFEYVPPHAGVVNGAVRIADSSLALDNTHWFTLNVSENIRALLIEADLLSRVRPFHFLSLALDPSGGQAVNGILAEQGFLNELQPRELERHHVAVFANPPPFNAQAAVLLTRYLEGGGSVLVFAGGDVGPDTFAAFQNEALRKLFGARDPSSRTDMTFKDALAGLNDLLQMDLVTWQRLNTLSPAPSATVLAECRGMPMIVEQPVGAGRLIACAFSVRRDTSNWPELKSFPIAMIHLMTHAAHESQQHANIACGQTVRLTALDADDTVLACSYHDGAQVERPVQDGAASLSETWQPGIITAERATPRSLAVNTVASESELACWSSGKLSALASIKAHVLKADAAIDTQIRAARRGSDLSGILLVLLLFLLTAEALLGNAYLSNRRS
mgnify:FL=1